MKTVIMMAKQEYIYVLSDNPTKFSRKHREWIITNQNIINYLNRIPQNILSNPIQLNEYLLKILRHYRRDYLPISGHEYLPIMNYFRLKSEVSDQMLKSKSETSRYSWSRKQYVTHFLEILNFSIYY